MRKKAHQTVHVVKGLLPTSSLGSEEYRRVEDMLVNLSSRIEDLVSKAGAVTLNRSPYVSVSKIADFLGVKVNWIARNTRSPSKSKVRLSRDGTWVVDMYGGKSAFNRFVLAHEIGHVLIYSDNFKPASNAWAARLHSDLEEALCNIIARWILIPPQVSSLLKRRTLIDAIFCANVDFKIPFEYAGLRLMDCYEPKDNYPELYLGWSNERSFRRVSENEIEYISKYLGSVKLYPYSKLVLELVHDQRSFKFVESLFDSCNTKNPALLDASASKDDDLISSYNLLARMSCMERDEIKRKTYEYIRYGLPRLTFFHWERNSTKEFINYENVVASELSVAGKLMRSQSGRGQFIGVDDFRMGTINSKRFTEIRSWCDSNTGIRKALQVVWSGIKEPSQENVSYRQIALSKDS